uniref:Uncharacterized protein n=1 Tax=Arion vulgaris TaxID=1028688 RepID=A0A0B7B290_9EUPU
MLDQGPDKGIFACIYSFYTLLKSHTGGKCCVQAGKRMTTMMIEIDTLKDG